MQPHANKSHDIILVKAALRIAGGHRALQRETGVTRQAFWRLLTGKQKGLHEETRRELREFIDGK